MANITHPYQAASLSVLGLLLLGPFQTIFGGIYSNTYILILSHNCVQNKNNFAVSTQIGTKKYKKERSFFSKKRISIHKNAPPPLPFFPAVVFFFITLPKYVFAKMYNSGFYVVGIKKALMLIFRFSLIYSLNFCNTFNFCRLKNW